MQLSSDPFVCITIVLFRIFAITHCCVSFCFLFLNLCAFSLICSPASFVSVSKYLSHLWFPSLSLSLLSHLSLSLHLYPPFSFAASLSAAWGKDWQRGNPDWLNAGWWFLLFFLLSLLLLRFLLFLPCTLSILFPLLLSSWCIPFLTLCYIGWRYIHGSMLKNSLRWIHMTTVSTLL